MKTFDNAEDLKKWMLLEKEKSILWLEKYTNALKAGKLGYSSEDIMCLKVRHPIEHDLATYVGSIVENELFKKIDLLGDDTIKEVKYLHSISEAKIYTAHIVNFIELHDDIRYFYNFNLSIDGTEFKRQINNLKNNASELQKLSEETITIRLPKLPHERIYDFVKDQQFLELPDEEIKAFIHLLEKFDEKYGELKRFPSQTKNHYNEWINGANIVNRKVMSLSEQYERGEITENEFALQFYKIITEKKYTPKN